MNLNLYATILLASFFLILLVSTFSNGQCYYANELENEVERENYTAQNGQLNDPNKMIVIQGNTIPEKLNQTIRWDNNDANLFPVNGSPNDPKSMFVFAYNKCDLKCCGSSPYSCNGGCVCFTPEQKRMFKN